MAIAFVQDDHLSSAGVAQQVIAFGSNVAAGSGIAIVGRSSTGQSITAVSDTRGNTYSAVVTNSDANTRFEIWLAVNTSAGACTVTIDWSASNNPQSTILEYSGVVTTSVAAATDQTGNRDDAVSNHPCHTADLTPSENNCLVLGGGSTANSYTYSSSEANYTQRASGTRLFLHDWIQTTATATDADWTSTTNEDATNAMAIFKAAGAAAAGGWGRLLSDERNRLVRAA